MASSDNAVTEEIIKRRLLLDGDGMGDERKLNSLIKSYLNLVESEDSEENDTAAFGRLLGQIKQMEYVARRSCEVIQINEDAQEIYVDLKDQVENEIRETKEQIIKSKAQLEEATKHRKYSMEYDALAKLIESKPDRKMTEIKRMGLELELDTLRKRQDKIDEQLDYRKRSIAMLGHSIEFLKDLMQVSEEKFTRKVAKSSRQRNGETPMDVDSTSQSEPPSPVVMEQIPEEATVNGSAMIVDLKPASNGTASNTPTPVESCDKSKSEKYEDLSESEGEENS